MLKNVLIFTEAATKFNTPLYLYDENIISEKCKEVLSMPNAYGLKVRYAMKANSNKTLLRLITNKGLSIDASSLDECRRAYDAGIPYDKIMLTTQEVPLGDDREYLEKIILKGLKYNICSLRQLSLIADFASKNNIPLSMRIHPGVGSGESSTRNTGDKYSCFGIHLADIKKALEFSDSKNLFFDQVHVHIGSGGDTQKWRENIDRELEFVEEYFSNIKIVNFGGGLKEARMPGEICAEINELGLYAKNKIEEFYRETGRKLIMEIEPGTYIVANAGYLITKVIDKKQTGEDGFKFIITDGGMEVNSRPFIYGSQHPFYIISKDGEILSSENNLINLDSERDKHVIVGKCCESGDSQSLDNNGNIVPRIMADPKIGDYIVIGGCGAYCSSMTPFNYNSHRQVPEILLRENDELCLIRKRQSLNQITQNEVLLDL
ncbi:MAG TPA: diaminopimelate decarboxylase [Candidatus Pacearchaeota archaeon]|nr:diaminopimelate decarboxylase [archaeon BMS3Abin17]HDK42129.1 diaminopimelate decarboxylase [Candidatus Pacearchaeota archaeon]HDZ60888.1 diaminopimelate decarboxylase [Candidatus Pacearchaeota archaeon]